jgi:hypothetical protein
MRYQVQTPNHGVIQIEGPEGASDDQLKAVALQELHARFPKENFANTVQRDPMPAAETPRSGVIDKVADGIRATANGAFPWADKLAAGVNAVAPIDKLLGKNESSIWDGSSLSDAYHHNLQQEQGLTKAGQENSPYLSAAGNIGGAVASPLSKLVPGAGLAPALANGTAYGAIQGSGQAKDGNEASGGLSGTLEGAAGTLLGHGLVKGLGHVLDPVIDPIVQRLRTAGVPLTVGRLVPWLKGVEDKAAGTVPFAGDVIKAAQRRSIQGGNRAMVNDALSPIDVKIPDAIKPGRKTAAFAQDAASKAYNDSLTAMRSVPDDQFVSDLAAAQQKGASLPPDQAAHFKAVMDSDVKPFLSNASPAAASGSTLPVVQGGSDAVQGITGKQLQAIKIGLDKRIAKLDASGVPSDDFAKSALQDVRKSFMDVAQRQNPDLFQKYVNADSAYANVSRLNDAFAKMRSDKEVSPLAFAQSVAKKGYGTTTAKVASGNARMQQLSDDLAGTLPSSVSDSGTGGRLAQLAAGGVAFTNPIKTAIAGGAMALPYAPGIDRLLETIIAGARPAAVQTAGRGLKKIAPVAGRLALPSLLYGMQGQQ